MMAGKICITILIILLLHNCGDLYAQQAKSTHAPPEALERWRDMKFGLFLHWAPISLLGEELSWSRQGPRPGRAGGGTGFIPKEIYDNVYRSFCPAEFDANEWAQIIADAGAKYLVYTTKHHDGFCMYDAALTDYDIASTPIGRDLLEELAHACHQKNIGLGLYYSHWDWHHPDACGEHHERYLKYMQDQVEDLCSRYGTLTCLWFDGTGTAEQWNAERIFDTVRRLQPDILINDRLGLEGDFDTPENRIGDYTADRPWETCMKLGTQWSWKTNDSLSSVKDNIKFLAWCTVRNGNYLLNVGPMPTGRIEPRQVDVLRGIGTWLKRYGECIYGTRPGPFLKPVAWGGSCYRGNKVYLHILNWRNDTINLPILKNRRIAKASLLTGGRMSLTKGEDALKVHVPREHRDKADTVICFELDGSAGDALVGEVPAGLYSRIATASSVQSRLPGKRRLFIPSYAFDGLDSTYWMPSKEDEKPWLELDMESPQTFNRIVLKEYRRQKVQRFEFQYQENDKWVPFVEGKHIGNKELLFDPVTTRRVRLVIFSCNGRPSIADIQLFAPMRESS